MITTVQHTYLTNRLLHEAGSDETVRVRYQLGSLAIVDGHDFKRADELLWAHFRDTLPEEERARLESLRSRRAYKLTPTDWIFSVVVVVLLGMQQYVMAALTFLGVVVVEYYIHTNQTH